MAVINWQCPWCGTNNGIEEVEFRAASIITCEFCGTTMDMAPDTDIVKDRKEE